MRLVYAELTSSFPCCQAYGRNSHVHQARKRERGKVSKREAKVCKVHVCVVVLVAVPILYSPICNILPWNVSIDRDPWLSYQTSNTPVSKTHARYIIKYSKCTCVYGSVLVHSVCVCVHSCMSTCLTHVEVGALQAFVTEPNDWWETTDRTLDAMLHYCNKNNKLIMIGCIVHMYVWIKVCVLVSAAAILCSIGSHAIGRGSACDHAI